METATHTSRKLRLVALLLCWFFGLLGVHRFYVGKVGSGIAMLLLTITFFGMIVTGIWVLIDLIVIASGTFKDNDGGVLEKWSN